MLDNETKATYYTILDAQTNSMPVICGLGFVTNVLSLLVFLQPSLRRLSCSVYLAAKAVSDFLFLLTVFVIWLARMDVRAFHMPGICQLVVFLSYLTAFISIWLAVVLTVENLLCVLKPWYVQRSCNAYTAVVITAITVGIGILVYHFSLWNNGVRQFPNKGSSPGNVTNVLKHAGYVINTTQGASIVHTDIYDTEFHSGVEGNVASTENQTFPATSEISQLVCTPLDEFDHLQKAITYIDTLITLFVPLIILAVANAAIVVLAVRTTRRRNRLNQQKRQYQLPGTHLASTRNSSASLEAQASKFLFAVSMTTLMFHLPSHVIRLKLLVFGYNEFDLLPQRVFETLYYTHYAIGFFVYLIFGKNFRKVFVYLILRHSS